MKKSGRLIVFVLIAAIFLTTLGFCLSFRKMLIQTEESLSAAENRLSQTEESLQEKEAELKRTETALRETEERYQSSEVKLSAAENRLSLTEESLQEKEAELKRTETALGETEERYRTSQEKLREAEKRLKQREEELESAEASLSEAKERCQTSEEEMSEKAEELERMEEALREAQELYRTSRESLTAADETLTQKEQELESIKEELAGMISLKKGAEAALSEAEEELRGLSEELESLRTEYETLRETTGFENLDGEGGQLLSKSWFDDALFFGDSQTGALEEYVSCYGGLGKAEIYYLNGLSCYNLITTGQTLYYEGRILTAEELIRASGAGKLYLLLVLNDLGCTDDQLRRCWNELIDRIQEANPELEIYIQSGTPLGYDAAYFTEKKVEKYNEILKEICRNQGCVYVDLVAALAGEDGHLKPEYAKDQVHMNNAGCEAWIESLFQRKSYLVPVPRAAASGETGE